LTYTLLFYRQVSLGKYQRNLYIAEKDI